jgi:histidyl-tRNA synthetase
MNRKSLLLKLAAGTAIIPLIGKLSASENKYSAEIVCQNFTGEDSNAYLFLYKNNTIMPVEFTNSVRKKLDKNLNTSGYNSRDECLDRVKKYKKFAHLMEFKLGSKRDRGIDYYTSYVLEFNSEKEFNKFIESI